MLNSKGQRERLDVAKKDRRRSNIETSHGILGCPVAFAGALVAAAGEIWHVYIHLQLSTHRGPIAGFTAIFGLVVVATALWPRRGQRL